MARGDTEYCRIELDFVLDDPRWQELSDTSKVIYLWLWARAVKDRRETLEKRWTHKAIARHAHSRTDYVRRTIRACTELGLLEVTEDDRITVCGVRSKHKKLRGWKQDNGDPYGDLSEDMDDSEREKEIEKDNPPPTPPRGASSGGRTLSKDATLRRLEECKTQK